MDRNIKAEKKIVDVWRMTNNNPVKKKAREKKVTPEMKKKHDKLSDHLFDELYKEEDDPFYP